MARRTRIQIPGLIRHITSRGNGKMDIFLDDVDRRKFLSLLSDVTEEYGITCWNYCVMSTHYHATLCPNRPNISEAMRILHGDYAQWWNDRHDHVGHTFQGRFKAQIVQKEGHLLTLCRYVVMNPVRAGIVADPADWPWSSYKATVGLTSCPSFLSSRSTLNLFGEQELAKQQARFAEYVVQPHPEDEGIVDRFRSKEIIVGDTAFKMCVRAEAGLDVEPAPAEMYEPVPI